MGSKHRILAPLFGIVLLALASPLLAARSTKPTSGKPLGAGAGTGAGISALLADYPDDNLIIAVLANTNGGGVPHARDIESELRFAPAAGRAEWIVHTLHGVHEDVLRRVK